MKKYFFTIVEMLTVIGISCILATMLLPALYGSISRSRLTVCGNQLRNIGNGINIYSNDNSGVIPNIMQGMEKSSIPILRLPGGTIIALGRLLQNGYLEEAYIFGCPDSPGYNGAMVQRNWQHTFNMVWSGYLYRSQANGFAPELNSPENFNKAIIMDFACKNTAGKDITPHNCQFSNILYTDNHVECRRNTPEPFEYYTARAARHGEVTPDCTQLWQHADQ